jgi:hypothetical protein
VRAQQEAEGDQSDVVALSRGAREDRERAAASGPKACEADQPLADEVPREVLLPHLELAARPGLADRLGGG